MLILSDFNCPDVDWNVLHSTSPHSSLFCDFVFRHNLSQLVSSPTHVLDLVLTTSPQFILNWAVLNTDFRYSDHFPVTFDLALLFVQHSRSVLPEILDYSKASYDGMNIFLLEYDYSDLLSLSDVDAIWLSLRSIILEAINHFIPKVVLRRSPFPKWYTRDIRHLIKRTHTLRRKCRQHPTPYLIDKLSRLEQDLGNQMSSAKIVFESNLVSKHSSNRSAIFRYISSVTNQRSLAPIMQLHSVSTSSDQEKADLFNKYFFCVFSHHSLSMYPFSPPSRTLSSIEVSPSDVYQALGSLDPSKSTGIDGIGPRVLKFCSAALVEPVHHLFSVSLSTGSLPKECMANTSSPLFLNLAQNQISLITGLYLCCA